MPPVHAFLLQAAKETFYDGIISAVSFSTHAAFKTMRVEQLPESFASVLAATV